VAVAGFQGLDERNNITTLGRGGSDTTAVALAAALKADVCEIFTDVDGVYTTDPNVCPKAQKMEFIAKDLAALAPPTDEELRAYFDKHRDRYQEPALYTFTQVFIDPDRRGDATLEDAEAIKAELIEGGDAIDDPGALGDSFMLASYYPEKDRVEIQKLFGGGFVESLIALSPGQWHGPVLSGYGTHLVYVNHIAEPREAVFAEVREQVEREWTAEKSEKLKDQLYAELLAQYSVVVERPAGDDKVAMLADEQSR